MAQRLITDQLLQQALLLGCLCAISATTLAVTPQAKPDWSIPVRQKMTANTQRRQIILKNEFNTLKNKHNNLNKLRH